MQGSGQRVTMPGRTFDKVPQALGKIEVGALREGRAKRRLVKGSCRLAQREGERVEPAGMKARKISAFPAKRRLTGGLEASKEARKSSACSKRGAAFVAVASHAMESSAAPFSSSSMQVDRTARRSRSL